MPGDARLFAGPGGASGQGAGPPHQAGGAALSASSGPHTALAPLAAARAGLGPPVQGIAGRAGTRRASAGLAGPTGRTFSKMLILLRMLGSCASDARLDASPAGAGGG